MKDHDGQHVNFIFHYKKTEAIYNVREMFLMIRNSGFWKNSFSFQYISAFRLINRYVGTIMFPNYTRNIFDNFKSLLYLKKGIVRRKLNNTTISLTSLHFLVCKISHFRTQVLQCLNVTDSWDTGDADSIFLIKIEITIIF